MPEFDTTTKKAQLAEATSRVAHLEKVVVSTVEQCQISTKKSATNAEKYRGRMRMAETK